MTRIKMCGLKRPQDIALASILADELGFVLEPSSPRFIQSPDEVSVEGKPLESTFAVFGGLPEVLPSHPFGRVQFIIDLETPCPRDLMEVHRPVLRPNSETDWGRVRVWLAEAASKELVLDPFHPHSYGGTGLRLDDALIERCQKELTLPIVIAGGLTPANVREVIHRHSPWGVDVSSGIEQSPGIKDHDKMSAFREAVLQA